MSNEPRYLAPGWFTRQIFNRTVGGLAKLGGPRATNSFNVRWRNPAGQVAPIAAARWTLCTPSGSGCVAGSAASGAAPR